MVDISFIEQNKSKNVVPKKAESKEDCVRRLTHLYLNEKFLQKIGDIKACSGLLVLYLHGNEIEIIENLDSARSLTHLYLQRNKIKRIENLGNLDQLKKLFLGFNEISVIEGLEKLTNLEELHVEKQRLDRGESLCFDPRSIHGIANNLQVLNISHNNITSIVSLFPLKFLKTINASHNNLSDIDDITNTIKGWFYLREAKFANNPVARLHRYRENIIAASYVLEALDDKAITDVTRCFIKRMKTESHRNKRRHRENTRVIKLNNLPKNIPEQIKKEISESIAGTKTMISKTLTSKPLNMEITENEADTYLPWNAWHGAGYSAGVPPLFWKLKPKKENVAKQPSTFPEL